MTEVMGVSQLLPSAFAIDKPRSMRDQDARRERRRLLHAPHAAPLRDYAADLRQRFPNVEFPDFDPLDGGVSADVLFLFEKPGPMTSAAGGGSGFISRNNDDPTAEATFRFMMQARIERGRTVIWNSIPGWDGTRLIARRELIDGVDRLKELLTLLPKVRAVVLVGKKAQRANGFLTDGGYHVLNSPHPSPLVRARWPDVWNRIPEIWAQAENL